MEFLPCAVYRAGGNSTISLPWEQHGSTSRPSLSRWSKKQSSFISFIFCFTEEKQRWGFFLWCCFQQVRFFLVSWKGVGCLRQKDDLHAVPRIALEIALSSSANFATDISADRRIVYLTVRLEPRAREVASFVSYFHSFKFLIFIIITILFFRFKKIHFPK